jgi:glucose/arabinose dehydrogenase
MSRKPVEMTKGLATVLEVWRQETMYATGKDLLFPSYRLDGKQPRLGSMIVEDYLRPAAIAAADKHPELKDKTIVPDVLLQPHNASLEVAFYEGSQFPAEYTGDIFASEHGSWNKAVRAGYEVIRVPLHQTGHATGDYEDFLTGFVLPGGQVWGRPVGTVVAPDGSLLVSDDGSNSVWRVVYTGK